MWLRVLINLPHPLEFIWLVWGILLPAQLAYLLRKNAGKHELSRTGELLNFREVLAIGCLGGFILLSFIFAFCTYLTLDANHII